MLAVNGFFLVIDLIFFAANALKLFEGGWFPLLLAVGVAFLMLTWRTGQRLVERAQRSGCGSPRRSSCASCRRPRRCACRARRRSSPPRPPGIPLVLTHHLKHNRVLHERVLLVSGADAEEPRVPDEADRVEVRSRSAHGISRVILRYGFMETPDAKHGVDLAISARAS